MANFRLQSKCIFLTYPRCDFALDSFVRNIENFFREQGIEKGVACQEHHADGGLHLHAAFQLKEKWSGRGADMFDRLVVPPAHPNISGKFRGGARKAFKYCMKEEWVVLPTDGSFDLEVFLDLAARKKNTTPSLMVGEIAKGADLDRLDDLFPEYLLLHHGQVERYLQFRELKRRRAVFAAGLKIPVLVKPADTNCFGSTGFGSSWNREIAAWINLNLRKPRAHRQIQLWIKGAAGCGKTSLMMWLEGEFGLSIYWWAKDELWWDNYTDNGYDLIVLDEFGGQQKITFINPLLSGDPVQLSRRNAPPLLKRNNLPMIICSNFTPEECYSKCGEARVAPLLDRVKVVVVEPGGSIRLERDVPWVPSPECPPSEPEDTPTPTTPSPGRLPTYADYASGGDQDYDTPTSFPTLGDYETSVAIADYETTDGDSPGHVLSFPPTNLYDELDSEGEETFGGRRPLARAGYWPAKRVRSYFFETEAGED